MPPESSFHALMTRLRAGDPDAAAQLLQRFAGRLIGLARRRLGRLLRSKVDPEDVLQSVWKSFFVRHAQGQFQLGDWDGLWALLTVLTLRKCGRWAGYYRAARRDVCREAAPAPSGAEEAPGLDFLDREPTPEEAAQLADTLGAALKQLDAQDREIVVLSLQGHDSAAVAGQVGCTQRTVQRVLREVRARLERQADAADEPGG
jgi:RNA polymerase sigma-70 factor (ECF subfamily)